MAKKSSKLPKSDLKKKRTREHIIINHSLVYVQYFIMNAGFTYEVVIKDYGYDLTVNTFDHDGLIEGAARVIQLKASEILTMHGDRVNYSFDLDMRDYNLWVKEPNPVFLIRYEATSRRAYWLYVQQYLKGGTAPKPKPAAKSVGIKIPKTNKVRTDFFRHARRLKEEVLKRLLGADPHG